MSWKDFAKLIDECNTNPEDWKRLVKNNGDNYPEVSLVFAINELDDSGQVKFAQMVIEMATRETSKELISRTQNRDNRTVRVDKLEEKPNLYFLPELPEEWK